MRTSRRRPRHCTQVRTGCSWAKSTPQAPTARSGKQSSPYTSACKTPGAACKAAQAHFFLEVLVWSCGLLEWGWSDHDGDVGAGVAYHLPPNLQFHADGTAGSSRITARRLARKWYARRGCFDILDLGRLRGGGGVVCVFVEKGKRTGWAIMEALRSRSRPECVQSKGRPRGSSAPSVSLSPTFVIRM